MSIPTDHQLATSENDGEQQERQPGSSIPLDPVEEAAAQKPTTSAVTEAASEPISLDDDENIEDNNSLDTDSSLGESSRSDTESINSDITSYREENGRRYHSFKEGSYWGPNDDKQNEQLDIAHHLHTLILDGKLYLAPIDKNIQNVLDLGTGTGIWAIDFADLHPSASVVGTDLSPIQPHWVPPNLRFEIDDFNESFLYKPNTFDFVHMRCLFGSVGDWPEMYRKTLEVLKPGAWFEQYEISIQFRSDDGSVTPDTALGRFSSLGIEAGDKFGKSLHIAEDMKKYIDEAGFINTVERVIKAPVRGWPKDPKIKEIGHWGLLELEVGLEGFVMALFTRVLGWEFTEVQAFLGVVRQELHSKKIHAWHEVHVVYGQKPL